jgi:hypothetical protein
MTFDTLLGDSLGNALGLTTFELTSKQVAQPSLQERDDTAHEEEPDSPRWSPDTNTRAFADWTSVESVVDQVLEILAHSDLTHQTVLVTVHARQVTDVSEGVVNSVGELEGFDVAQAVLHVSIEDELCQLQDFTQQVESVTKARLFTFFGSKSLDGLQVEVVIQMQVVQVLAMNEQVQHVVALTANLQTSFDPIDFSRLEELGRFEGLEQ